MNINYTYTSPKKGHFLIITAEPFAPELIDFVEKTCNCSLEIFSAEFSGKEGTYCSLINADSKFTFLGIGKKPSLAKTLDGARNFAFKESKKLSNSLTIITSFLAEPLLETSLEAIFNGFKLATNKIGKYKSEAEEKHPFLAEDFEFIVVQPENTNLENAVKTGITIAESQLEIIDLANAPANKKTPQHIANWAKNSAAKYGFKLEIKEKETLIKEGFEALLAVNRGSEDPAICLVLEYKHPEFNGPKIALVGKGVTFDTGGVSIKPSQNMHLMKSDMGGAAAVLGAFEAAAKLKLECNLVAVIPLTDNLVDALSIKPGDVIGSYSKKTIEIIDTDAEGRLILADALSYAIKNHQPDVVIDLATLTGAAVRTFGYACAALFTNNEKLSDILSKSGYSVDEKLWPLPLWDDFLDDIKSDVADVKNFSGKPIAGAISAAKFLEFFTEKHTAWAHLDIAGVAFKSNQYGSDRNATGFGVRLLLESIQNLKDFKNN